jgi:hypothetical protein
LVVGAAAAQAGEHKFTVVERYTATAITDVGDKGDSVGDVMTYRNELYDAENKKKVGYDNGYCLMTDKVGEWECAWTNVLDGGSIMVSGPFNAKGGQVAIVGGTGRYSGARGVLDVKSRNDKEADFSFDLAAK